MEYTFHPHVKRLMDRFMQTCANESYEVIITSTLRTFAEQDELYAQGRTKPGEIVTNARGGQSMHNYGLAFDFAVKWEGKVTWDEWLYDQVGPIGENLGLTWGGRFSPFMDRPHMEWTGGFSLMQLQAGWYPADPEPSQPEPIKEITVEDVIAKLAADGVIDNPDYWRCQIATVQYLDVLLVKVAKQYRIL